MESPSQELSKFKQDKLLRDAEIIAKRQIWILIATVVVFFLAVTAIVLAGYALRVQDSTAGNNIVKVTSNSQVDNGQTESGRHPNESEVFFIAQRTSDLEAKINATNVLLKNLRDKEEEMKEQISSLINELNALKNNISDINALGTVNIAATVKPWSTTSGTSSSGSVNKAPTYVTTVGFFVLFISLC